MSTPASPAAGGGRGSLARLAHQVLEANADVQDVLDVTALIESFGYSDRRIRAEYGYASMFDLAEAVHREVAGSVTHRPLPTVHAPPWRTTAWTMLGQFVHGLTFAVPMTVSIAAMVFLKISFAAYQNFDLEQATALTLATFFSFMTTGGFTQVMAYVYYVLVGAQEHDAVLATLTLVVRWGMAVTGAFCLALFLVDTAFPVLPVSVLVFALIYTVPLSAMWLSYTGMYVLRREYLLTVATAVAIGVAYLLWKVEHVPVTLAQIAAMLVGSLLTVAMAAHLFRRAAYANRQGAIGRIVRTRASHLAYGSAPYFAYGLLYFTFVFADRLISFTTNTNFLPLGIWFRGPYELAMDWALLALILPLGAAEPFVTLILSWLMRAEQAVAETRLADLVVRLRRIYLSSAAALALIGAAGYLLSHLLVALARTAPLLAGKVPIHGGEPLVFTVASLSYSLLIVGLFNVLLLFTLARPVSALRAFGLAIAVDLAVGLVASRLGNADALAVLGLAAGVLYLLVATTLEILRVIRVIDYTLFQLT